MDRIRGQKVRKVAVQMGPNGYVMVGGVNPSEESGSAQVSECMDVEH
jgi:hypothetical protein